MQNEPSVAEIRFDCATLLRVALGYFDTAEDELSQVEHSTILAISMKC